MSAPAISQTAPGRALLSPLMVGIIALAAFAGGLGISRVVPSTSSVAGPGTQAAQPFNAAQFRAQEHAAFNAAPTFDAVQFRAQERQP